MKKGIFIGILLLIIGFIYYYLMLPPINLTSPEFYLFIIFLLITYIILEFIFFFSNIDLTKMKFKKVHISLALSIPIISICIILLAMFIVNVIISPLFMSKTYSRRIEVDETGDFTKDILPVDFNRIPLLDRDSSEKLGDRVMGGMSEYVSQYYVSDEYTQINYKDEIIRVTPIEYDGLIKWFTNKENGASAYITVNSVSGEAKLIKLDKGMKYMPSAYFNEDLSRTLRFKYPTKIFAKSKFEIDDEGNPYWITPTIKYTGIGALKAIDGVVLLNPINGESNYYKVEDIPEWVDNAYNASLVIEQVNDWGTYRNGFINSIFGQKNVVNTTAGYNYLALDNDIYLYTGITSVLSDESNLGFILTNMRTGNTVYYSVPGAEEYSAMDSARGQVQQMNYVSTFPLLINLNNKPTYLVSLKDAAGLVKMYGFVDVEDYQKVVVSDASLGINNASKNYLEKYGSKNNKVEELQEKEIVVKKITNATIDGNTIYYIVDQKDSMYYANIHISNKLPFVEVNDKLKISYYNESDITEIVKIV